MKLIPVRMDKSEKPPYTRLRATEAVQMSKMEARKLLLEIKPQIKGCVVGEFPIVEKLAALLQIDLELVS